MKMPPATQLPRFTAPKQKRASALVSLEEAVQQKIATLQLPGSFAKTVHTTYREIAGELLRQNTRNKPRVVGVCGCQGSGKSTLAAFLKLLLDWEEQPTAILSLDDLYLTKRQREKLARDVHPLLRTRGVPGTHDVKLGIETLCKLGGANAKSRTAIPRFDKSRDDRAPRKDWDTFKGRPAFILFEGWCVDAKPQPEAALRKPINRLERDCDPDCIWRRYVNDQLGGPYRKLFAPIDLLLFMQAPSFDCVYKWRGLQEKKLREARKREGSAVMNKQALETFIMHYERLTRWMLKEMPSRADILLPLAPDQHIRAVEIRAHRKRHSKQ
jgi:D-glycerate 3-kinase